MLCVWKWKHSRLGLVRVVLNTRDGEENSLQTKLKYSPNTSSIIDNILQLRRRGLMDKAPDFESGDYGFESHRGQTNFFLWTEDWDIETLFIEHLDLECLRFSFYHLPEYLGHEVYYLHGTDEREASEEPHGSSYSW